MIPRRVPDLLRVDQHLERVRLGPARGQDVDVDGRAAADRGEQQLDRGEVGSCPGPHADLPATVIAGRVPAVLGPLEPYAAMRGVSRHAGHHVITPAVPGTGPG